MMAQVKTHQQASGTTANKSKQPHPVNFMFLFRLMLNQYIKHAMANGYKFVVPVCTLKNRSSLDIITLSTSSAQASMNCAALNTCPSLISPSSHC